MVTWPLGCRHLVDGPFVFSWLHGSRSYQLVGENYPAEGLFRPSVVTYIPTEKGEKEMEEKSSKETDILDCRAEGQITYLIQIASSMIIMPE